MVASFSIILLWLITTRAGFSLHVHHGVPEASETGRLGVLYAEHCCLLLQRGERAWQSISWPLRFCLEVYCVAQSTSYDQARKWPSPGQGSKYLCKLTQFTCFTVFLSHHKYLV